METKSAHHLQEHPLRERERERGAVAAAASRRAGRGLCQSQSTSLQEKWSQEAAFGFVDLVSFMD
ncbi:hypothetical protein Taro_054603 [Colocasia esculenta]|uniref:Uncharacterized protein n=1 Tax=Colocasia esculenta TaxID=4460 RepID=A0A843XR68_COLES|nr:hypothetical protein [Colocasia esculenta]